MAAPPRPGLGDRGGALGAAVLVALSLGILAVAMRASAASSGVAAKAPANGCCACPAPPVPPIAMRPGEEDDGWNLSFAVPTYAGYTDAFLRFDQRP